MYICTGDPPPPSVLPCHCQPLSSHPNVTLDFCGGDGDGGGGVAMARWVALAAFRSIATMHLRGHQLKLGLPCERDGLLVGSTGLIVKDLEID